MRKTATIAVNVLAACALAFGIAGAAHAQQSTTTTPSATTPKKLTSTTATAKPKSTAARTAAPLALTTDKEKQSYALGMNIARGLKRQEVDADPALVARGLRDTLSGAKPLLTDAEAEAALTQLQMAVQGKQQAEMKKLGDDNMKEGQEFLDANKTKEGVVTLPSGLQYKILTAGTGPKPAASDTVVCNYRGTFINGTEFDSSYKRNQPATFPLNGVIKGWTEALQLMPVGSKWELYIPSDLAYGPSGRGPIPPNATLIFQVELLSIQGQK
ncbi:MAG TPA: FKBP-type peptidyl-prolyl cis-trans isomerase [Candidatus Acidoferrales bacterium]|jgi:FKBP-type peptidyl-prolyl cis-trans isomerase|nr:FKBP-type peptidyl-prolyl cis-trans isomerase [Candidatus Acidoferrales bacterium]